MLWQAGNGTLVVLYFMSKIDRFPLLLVDVDVVERWKLLFLSHSSLSVSNATVEKKKWKKKKKVS